MEWGCFCYPPASTWFDELEPAVSSDVQKVDSAFRDRFLTAATLGPTLESTPQAQKTSVSSIQPSSFQADAISQQAKELQELKQLKTVTVQPVVAAASVHITCQLCRNTGHSATDCQLYVNRLRWTGTIFAMPDNHVLITVYRK